MELEILLFLMRSTKPKPRKKALPKTKTPLSPVIDVTRKIKLPVQILLFVRAGGRCQFDGCNRYLTEHHLTHKRGNFAQMAHVVAFSTKGPRGNVPNRPEDINEVDNLMLLCHPCHKLIDDSPEEYLREVLEAYKKAHEDRVFLLTGTSPDRQTTVVAIRAKIGGKPTKKVSSGDINSAVAPRYSATREGFDIDLNSMPDEGPEFYELAMKKVRNDLERVVETTMSEDRTNHLSIFPLAPMPILIYAGSILGDKVGCDLYQKHRDTEDWKWKENGDPVRYKFHELRKGKDRKKVALVLSLSGTIDIDSLPEDVRSDATVYGITLDGVDPHPGFLHRKDDLESFRDVYQRALRAIGTKHGKLDSLHLFPAAPAPIAVTCGRGLMPKADPTLVVYDEDKRLGGFTRILEVNN